MDNDSSLKPVVSDVVKEFKAAGHFDRLRKECFAEIVSQSAFQNLNKNIEDFVKKFLNDQERLGSSLKKNDIREMLKRKLYENYSFNNELTILINQSIESKKESALKPIIDSLVESIVKANEPENEARPAPDTPTFIPEHIAFTPVQEVKPTLPPPPPPPTQKPLPPQPQAPQPKVSIEDFLSTESKSTPPPVVAQVIKTEKIRKVSESDKPIAKPLNSKPVEKEANKEEVKKDEIIRKEEKSTTVSKAVTKPQVSKPAQVKKPSNVKPSTSTTKEIDSLTRKITISAEANLEADPTHEYNFDWKLDQIDSKIFDEISVSSVNTSDLSDFSQYDDSD